MGLKSARGRVRQRFEPATSLSLLRNSSCPFMIAHTDTGRRKNLVRLSTTRFMVSGKQRVAGLPMRLASAFQRVYGSMIARFDQLSMSWRGL